MTIDEAVDQGRVHHQWLPDHLRVEKARAPKPKEVLEIERRGHKVVKYILQGDANSILIDERSGTAYGFADTRQGGLALGPVAAAPTSPRATDGGAPSSP
jgi:gamma-glutamyltranspeptidase/glutathione hydrolase